MKLGKDEIFYMKAASSIAGVNAIGCLVEGNCVSFLVKPETLGVAIGKNGSRVNRIKQKIGKNVELFPYCSTADEFVKMAFRNISIGETETSGTGSNKTMSLHLDSTNRRMILSDLGRLSRVRKIASKTYGLSEIKIR